MDVSHKVAAGLGVLALAIPAGAVADSGKEKTRNYNAKGTYAGDGVVNVEQGNGAVKKAGWRGQAIAFDFSQANIRTEDRNGDVFERFLAVGSKVRVKAELAKGDLGPGPYVAERLDDKSEDADEESAS
jgi:hypothetical protein